MKPRTIDILESFQNEDGTRVASRWRVRGKHNGMFYTEPDQRPVAFTGSTIWQVTADGKLVYHWVERAALEVYFGSTPRTLRPDAASPGPQGAAPPPAPRP